MSNVKQVIPSDEGTPLQRMINGLLLLTFIFASLVQHAVSSAANEAWITLAAGIIFIPVGIVHGCGIWLGIWS